MNNEIIAKYLIHDNQRQAAEYIDHLDTKDALSIYEVIRVVNGVPLFLEKHLARMQASAKLLGYTIDGLLVTLERNIYELIEINGNLEKNIRVVAYNLDHAVPEYVMYYVKSSYPTADEYQKGVPTVLLHAERKNPNAKVVNSSFKENVAKLMEETKSYEALLVNENGLLTEGSRSNLFFIKGSRLYTAPSNLVLVGITRVYVLEACKRCGVDVVEEAVRASELALYDGMFISGTSPKVLPISSIDGKAYASAANPVIMCIMKAYDEILDEYIKSKK